MHVLFSRTAGPLLFLKSNFEGLKKTRKTEKELVTYSVTVLGGGSLNSFRLFVGWTKLAINTQ